MSFSWCAKSPHFFSQKLDFCAIRGNYLKKSAVQFFYFSYGKTSGRNLSSATKKWNPRCLRSNWLNYQWFRLFKGVPRGALPYYVRNFYLLIHFSSFRTPFNVGLGAVIGCAPRGKRSAPMMRTRRCAIGPFSARFGLFLVKNSFFDLEISKNGQNRVFLGQKLGSYFFGWSRYRIL